VGRKTRTLTLFVGLAIAAGTTVATTASAATPINGTGTVSCHSIAVLKFNPALSGVPGHPVVPTTITLKSTLTSCTGTGDGAHIVSGKSTVVTHADSNDCTERLSPSEDPSTPGDITWKVAAHTTKLNKSRVQFTSETVDLGPPVVQESDGSSISGSFNGQHAHAHSVLQETSDQITAACLSKKGLKIIHVVSGSTFALSNP
jgi:hypothetical protein